MNNSIINQGTISNDSKQNATFYITIFVLITLIVVTVSVLYTQGKKAQSGKNLNSNSLKSGDLFIIIISCFFLAAIFFLYIKFPDIFRNIVASFTDSYYLILLILYIFFTIILYQNILTPDQVTNYSYIILPITVILFAMIFYANMNKSIGQINQTVNQIKYSIIYFCLILFLSILYFINPADYINHYMGPYLVVSILLSVFGFLYLLTLMTFPTKSNNNSDGGLLSRFKFSTILSVIIFILFIIVATIGITTFPGGFFNSSSATQTTIIILLILISIFWIILFGLSLFQGDSDATGQGTILSKYGQMFRNVVLLLFGLTFSGLLIYWIVISVESLSQTSNIISFLLNMLIILAALGLTFKIITSTNFYQNSPLARLVVNSILYIPCLFVTFVDRISHLFGFIKTPASPSLGLSYNFSSKENTNTYFIYIAIILLALLVYMFYPYVSEKVTNQGGLLLVNQPIYLNELHNLASYQTLNQITNLNLNDPINPMQFNYNYGISFWVFLDSTNPSKMDQYVSILNYGNKPNVLFGPSENTLLFTMNKTDSSDTNNLTMQQLTDQGTQIMYEHKNVLLQKWNHIFMQYNGGTFDIFINGKLAKSINGVLPYKTLDEFQIGTNHGIQGGICNVNYFKTFSTHEKIQNLYNFFKDKTPPVHSSSQDTIINVLEQIPNIITNKPIQVSTNSNYTDTLNSTLNTKLKAVTKDVNNIETGIDNSYLRNFLSWDWYFKNNKY